VAYIPKTARLILQIRNFALFDSRFFEITGRLLKQSPVTADGVTGVHGYLQYFIKEKLSLWKV